MGTNASTILNDDMTLEEKLAAIELAMANAQAQAKDEAESNGVQYVESDPYDALMCEGCQ